MAEKYSNTNYSIMARTKKSFVECFLTPYLKIKLETNETSKEEKVPHYGEHVGLSSTYRTHRGVQLKNYVLNE